MIMMLDATVIERAMAPTPIPLHGRVIPTGRNEVRFRRYEP